MKSIIATALFSIATAVGFCDDVVVSHHPVSVLPTDLKLTTVPVSKQSFSYIRLGLSDKDTANTFETIPAIGLGYRYGLKDSAVDVSVNYTNQVVGTHIENRYFYTIPKATYLRYVSDDTQAESFYYGAGCAWGGLRKSDETRFLGLIPSATIGYEMNRKQNFHSFFQLDVSEPLISFSRQNKTLVAFTKLASPVAEVSVGLGY